MAPPWVRVMDPRMCPDGEPRNARFDRSVGEAAACLPAPRVRSAQVDLAGDPSNLEAGGLQLRPELGSSGRVRPIDRVQVQQVQL
jgi:hypothetical protein